MVTTRMPLPSANISLTCCESLSRSSVPLGRFRSSFASPSAVRRESCPSSPTSITVYSNFFTMGSDMLCDVGHKSSHFFPVKMSMPTMCAFACTYASFRRRVVHDLAGVALQHDVRALLHFAGLLRHTARRTGIGVLERLIIRHDRGVLAHKTSAIEP